MGHFHTGHVCCGLNQCVVPVEDEGKGEDAQSAVSGGEEYEPISDDELDEILADSQKRDDQQDEEKIPGKWVLLAAAYTCSAFTTKVK